MITHLTITNMAGFTSFSAALPSIALIQGANKQGKTSLLSCIQYVYDEGHDPDMLHAGTDEGETILTYDDGSQLRVRITKQGTSRFSKPKDGTKWVPGRKVIESLAQSISYRPFDLLTLPEKDQLSRVLSVVPVRISGADILAITKDIEGQAQFAQEPSDYDLSALAMVRNSIYTKRTQVNAAADQAAKHAKSLLDALPPAIEGDDWQAEAKRLGGELAKSKKALDEKIQAVGAVFGQAKQSASSAYESKVSGIEKLYREALAEAAAERDKTIEDARESATEQAADLRAKIAPTVTQLTTELAVAKERADSTIRTETTRANAKIAQEEAEIKAAEAKRLTAAIAALDELKVKAGSQLSAKLGIVIEDGRIGRMEHGAFVPLAKWNTADQGVFALRVAIAANKAGFVVLDGAEIFDAANREKLMKTCAKYVEQSGLQFFIGSVADGPLVVADAKA